MAFITLQDYFPRIQNLALQQLITNEDSYRLTAQEEALQEIKTYLVQKYNVSNSFPDTLLFDFSTAYNAKQLVYLDADAYDPTSTYEAKSLTLYSGNIYYNNAPITVAEAFTLEKWTLIGAQYALCYIPAPKPEFNYKNYYAKDDQVFRNNKIYKALKATSPLSQQAKLQYTDVDQLPLLNEFPEVSGNTQWQFLRNYSIKETFPDVNDSENIWVFGDNRNQQLVGINVMISIYKLSPRVSPKNIPDIWVKNYDDSISWLKKCAKGEVTLDAPLIQPSSGSRIRWGSKTKNINNY